MPSKKPRKKKRPIERILHSAMALTGRNSYISPEPKRCVERKVLNFLARFIAYLRPVVGDDLQKTSGTIRDLASSSVEKVSQSSIRYYRLAMKCHAGK